MRVRKRKVQLPRPFERPRPHGHIGAGRQILLAPSALHFVAKGRSSQHFPLPEARFSSIAFLFLAGRQHF